jgi:hypothetical protein
LAPKLKLPEVTLVCVETREHELARMAIEECVAKADFGDVLILTDKPAEFPSLGRIHLVPDWPEKIGWSRSWWYDVPPLLRTRQTLNIQWDSWIWDVSMWDDAFLDYDYIGAPWWYRDGKNVGNGGFSLVSTRLKRFLRAHQHTLPCDTALDDDLLCRKYRLTLENHGFVWAPESVAHRFAFECSRPSPTSRHFGFHGAFNFGIVLSAEELERRARIMLASPYIAKPDGYIFQAFAKNNPQLVERLLRETLREEKGLHHG